MSEIAVLTDDPAYGLRAVEITGPSGPLRIRLHAAWDATHYAANPIREFIAALGSYCAG